MAMFVCYTNPFVLRYICAVLVLCCARYLLRCVCVFFLYIPTLRLNALSSSHLHFMMHNLKQDVGETSIDELVRSTMMRNCVDAMATEVMWPAVRVCVPVRARCSNSSRLLAFLFFVLFLVWILVV